MEPAVDGRDGAPPWTLEGEAFAALARDRGSASAELAGGIDRLPGPVLVVAASWHGTPMGPYRELAIGVPARVGSRPGWCITTMVVDSEASCRAGRANWGMPKELGDLAWGSAGGDAELRWDRRAIEVRARPVWRTGPAAPVVLPVPLVQQRGDGPVAVTGTARGRARPAWVELTAPPDDPLAPLAGRHPGVHLPRIRLWLGAAAPR